MEYRILVVCQRFWPENQKLADICEGFVERGMKVDVLCGQPSFLTDKKTDVQKGPEIRNGVRIFRAYETSPDNRGSLGIFANLLSFRLSSVAKLKELEKIRYDKVFIYQVSPVTMCAAGIRLGQSRRLDVTMFVAELWPHFVMDELDVRSTLFKRFLDKLAGYYYTRADKLIVNSPNTKAYFVQELGIKEDKIRYIPQTAEKIYENPSADNDLLERFAGSFKIVYTGIIGRKQKFHAIVNVAERMIRKGIRNLRFVIVGDGTTLEGFREAVRERRLQDYFIFEGAKSETEIPKYLNLADVLFDIRRPNEAEDFYVPGKLASYMAAGRPLLLAMGGDAGKIVKDAGCGFVSEPEDEDALYANLMKLYRMPRKERLVLGAKARAYQLEHFNRDKNIVLLMEEIHATKRQEEQTPKETKDNYEEDSRKEESFNWIDDEFREF